MSEHAGHDTTSSTICYIAYMLSKNPDCLARIRKEHDDVLGPLENTPDKIKRDPYVLNKLEYTTPSSARRCDCGQRLPACGRGFRGSKHMMRRLATGSRRLICLFGYGRPELSLSTKKTTDFVIITYQQVISFPLHRSEAIWGPTAHNFDPSRFMPENASQLPENGWRAFERGPRNCIGQDLALLEARIILALIVRRFDFQPAFDSLHELANDGSTYARDEGYRTGRQDLDGEEAYPILIGSAKPREGMPMRVKMVQE